jgi:mono/diheme cytochrome c family protein
MRKGILSLLLFGLAWPALALADAEGDFEAYCLKCHGGNAKTNTRRALMLKIDPKKMYLPASERTKEEMAVIIEKGKNQMPRFGDQLSPDQINSLVDFISAQKIK